MSVLERFEKAYSSIEVEWASSLPVCNKEHELLFFYSTAPAGDYSFRLLKLEKVLLRNHLSGDCMEYHLTEEEQKAVRSFEGQLIEPAVFDEKAFELEDLYYQNYELFYDAYVRGLPAERSAKPSGTLFKTFDTLVPNSALKDLYQLLGSEYFELLKEREL